MKLSIHLYVTSRSSPAHDLDDVKTARELRKWRDEAKKHALETKEYDELEERLIDDMSKLIISECYAVIAYPPGKIHEAGDQVGETLLKFLRKNTESLNWELEKTGISAITVAELAEKHPMLDHSKLWENFTYGLIADKRLKPDEYEVDLEAVVKE